MSSANYFYYYFLGVKPPLFSQVEKHRTDSVKNNSHSKASNHSDPITCEEVIEMLPSNCNTNLITTEFFPNITSTGYISYAKPSNPDTDKEWKDVSYNAEEAIINNIPCDPGNTCTEFEDQDVLKYKVVYPTDYPYTCSVKPPCVIFFHAGGYSDCNSIEGAYPIVLISELLARRGFVCFSVEYRRGRVLSDEKRSGYLVYDDINYTTAQQLLAYYRAFQDGRGAIRSIIKRNGETATPYKFDVNNIFLGGFSAGAGIVTNAAYYTQSMIDEIDGGIGSSKLGSIDGDYYYGEPTINYKSKIKGVLNCWGNAYISLEDKENPENYFSASSMVPLISFHGKNDWIVAPYNNQPVFFAPDVGGESESTIDPNYSIIVNPETRCLRITALI